MLIPIESSGLLPSLPRDTFVWPAFEFKVLTCRFITVALRVSTMATPSPPFQGPTELWFLGTRGNP